MYPYTQYLISLSRLLYSGLKVKCLSHKTKNLCFLKELTICEENVDFSIGNPT